MIVNYQYMYRRKSIYNNSCLSINMHMNNGEKPDHCEYCDMAFSNQSYLPDHMGMHRYSNLANYRLYTGE